MSLPASELSRGHTWQEYDCSCRLVQKCLSNVPLLCMIWILRGHVKCLPVIPHSCFFRLPAHPHVRPELQQPQPGDQLRRRQQEHHVRGLPRRWTLDVHGRRGLHGSHMGPQVPQRKLTALTFTLRSANLTLTPAAPSRSRNLQCQRIFQVNAPINCVCLHPNQVRLAHESLIGANTTVYLVF